MKTPISLIALWVAFLAVGYTQSAFSSTEWLARFASLPATGNPVSSLPDGPAHFQNSAAALLSETDRFLSEFAGELANYSGHPADLTALYHQFGQKGREAEKAFRRSRDEQLLRTAIIWNEMQLRLVWPIFVRQPIVTEDWNMAVTAGIERTLALYFSLYQQDGDPLWLQAGLAAIEKGRCLALKQKRSEKAASGGEFKEIAVYRHFLERESRLDLPELQTSLLQHDQCVIRFFEGRRHLYLFVIDRHKAELLRIGIDRDYQALVRGLSASIVEYATTDDALPVEAYVQGAYQLYELLFGKIRLLGREVTLIPDGSMAGLPFEALLTAPVSASGNLRKLPYLIRDCRISYRYTLTSFWERTEAPKTSRSRLLALAPASTRGSLLRSTGADPVALESPRANREEVEKIGRYFPTTRQIGETAGCDYFRAQAAHYPLIHLATHGGFDAEDGRRSFLTFSGANGQEEKLFAGAIPQTPLHAELVVLSACESGLGNWADPAGPNGMAYGFAQAGAHSTVSTLWKISDRASTEIMKHFYKNLRAGLPKDEALRQAKLSYLDAQPSRLAHPFYWAAFIASGDMNCLATNEPAPIKWVVILLLLVAGLYFYRRR